MRAPPTAHVLHPGGTGSAESARGNDADECLTRLRAGLRAGLARPGIRAWASVDSSQSQTDAAVSRIAQHPGAQPRARLRPIVSGQQRWLGYEVVFYPASFAVRRFYQDPVERSTDHNAFSDGTAC